jgi:UDP-N-acetylmuramyl pentapeptide synthase
VGRRTQIVAVVGSFGKTTTARTVATALGKMADPKVSKNFSSYVAESVLRIGRAEGQAVIEVGIECPGEMARYARLVRPDVVVVTAVGSEHNYALGSLEDTRAEKVQMVRALPRAGLAVLNWDDPNVRWMAGQTAARVRSFGFGADCQVRASEVALEWPRGTRFRLWVAGQTHEVRTRLIGRPGVYAILAAVAVVLEAGFDLEDVLPRLEALGPTPGRLELVGLPNGAYLLRDDFKSTEETFDAALDVLAEAPATRRMVVLGEIDCPPDGGPPSYHRVGERVGRVASRAVVVGKAESFQQYVAGVSRAGLDADAFVQAGTSPRAALEVLRQTLGPGDVVLIKGSWVQRLDRVALGLAGRQVGCEITFCAVRQTRCDRCPMLERGWGGLQVIT